MNLLTILRENVLPGTALLPARWDTPEARVMLLAIGLQESRFVHRRQIKGPARGFWQFEQGGGVRGVLEHPASRRFALEVCEAREVTPAPVEVYRRLEHDDLLAAAFARLLLYTDPRPLPRLRRADEAWDYYERNWRPGKPHPETWPGLYDRALTTISDGQA